MTREQAERLKRAKRRKRMRKKRIRAICILIFSTIVLVAMIFLLIKATMDFIEKKDNTSKISSGQTQSSQQESVAPESQNAQTTPETPPVESQNTQSQQPSTSQTQPVPNIPKPEPSWSTILVNKTTPMPQDYQVEVREILDTKKSFDVRAADSLEAMLNDARKAGFNMYLVSSYRSVSYQQGLFDRKVKEYIDMGYDQQSAINEASKWVAIPGTSEHSLGLAADIVSSTWYNTNNDLTAEFENTPHFKWLYENCANYGFILRFPRGKESITDISYEPWHYRYVGVEAAKYIMANNITLEEYHSS